MKTVFVFSPCWITSLIAFKCAERADEFQSQIENLDFELVVLDELGDEKSVFEANTDVNFALRVNNNSGSILIWKYDYGCQLVQNEDFLLVYKKIDSGDEGGGDQPEVVGRPFSFPSYCLTVNLSPDTIPPGVAIAFRAPWSTVPENEPLGVGKYFTAINHILNINGHQKALESRVDFEIK